MKWRGGIWDRGVGRGTGGQFVNHGQMEEVEDDSEKENEEEPDLDRQMGEVCCGRTGGRCMTLGINADGLR